MKILFWSEFYWPHVGGIEILVNELSHALGERGHAAEIITNHYSPVLPSKELCQGIPVHRIDLAGASRGGPRAMFTLLQEVREIRRRFEPSINHFFLSGPLALAHQMTNHSPRLPTVTSLQTPLDGILGGGSSVVKLLRDSEAILAPNSPLMDGIRHYLPEVAERLHRVTHSAFRFPVPPAALPLDPPVLLCLGRLVKEKGFDLALHAFARLGPGFEQVRLIIAGEGPERGALEGLAATLDLTARVEFTGIVDREEIGALINRSTLMLVPSRWEEPFGIVCLEAGMMARPVVANRVGGIPGVIGDRVTGLLVENENPEALADAIRSLLNDPERMAAMGDSARKRAGETFGFDAYLTKHLSIYEEAVTSPLIS